jgi:hypothetical protein
MEIPLEASFQAEALGEPDQAGGMIYRPLTIPPMLLARADEVIE